MNLTARLTPMDVAARVVNAATKVPLLSDEHFEATGVLEKGIHVHWALPDALTQASSREDEPARFRGVPDLWLVVRYNPVSGSEPRSHRAWVLDSLTERISPLGDWQPPDNRDESKIHTAPGFLRRAGNGWGELEKGASFDPLVTAYYPACRTRFGFYDDLADLGGATNGKVSYTIVGWYSRISFDPFYAERYKRRTRLGPRGDIRQNKVHVAALSKSRLQSELRWDPSVRFNTGAEPKRAELKALINASQVQASSIKTTLKASDLMIRAVPLGATDSQHAVVDSLMPSASKTYAVLHGSVMDVPLRESLLFGLSKLPESSVFLYPNVQRATAEIASRDQTEQKIDWLEMMLGNLGQQSGSVAGVVDLPGAQHARTFQSVPGKTTYYARLDIYPLDPPPNKQFALADIAFGPAVLVSGHWPALQERTSSLQYSAVQKLVPSFALNQPPAQPAGPTDAEIIAWIEKLRTDFDSARQQSAANGRPLDERLIRVQDNRAKAQPTPQGRYAGNNGADTAGWWIDMGEPGAPIDIANNEYHKALAELRRSIGGAKVHMPEGGNLFEVPGPRWYRPWAPHLVIYGAKRSYRHGMDGRFRADGHLYTRVSGETLIGLRAGRSTVLAKDIVKDAAQFSTAGLPNAARSLVLEHVLADAENAPIMAKRARTLQDPNGAVARPTAKQMVAAARSIWLQRAGATLKPEEKSAIDLIQPVGTPSSAAGLQAWRDWYGPLFLDSKYTHRRKRFNNCFTLLPNYVEAVDKTPPVAPDLISEFTDRQIAHTSVIKVLKSSLVTELGIDPYGKPIKKKAAPQGVSEKTFDEMDVVSASLNKLDDQLFAAGERELGGYVHLNQVRLFDTFGTPVEWASSNASIAPPPDWATALPARLSCWGRLNFRLQSAADGNAEATPLTPPVCGILLPDLVDQALEVYDADGAPIGQLTADDPIRNNSGAAKKLNVKFTLLPWVAANLAPGADPVLAIQNATLRALVESLLAQSIEIPAGASGWHETGFTAMMRVFDTVRSTLDPSIKVPNPRVRLLGEPIIVMNARLSFQASNDDTAGLRGNPSLVTSPPELPVLRVRVGDVTRPDDGVLGCFLVGNSPAEGRFAPVSLQAATDAVLNQMVFKSGSQKTQSIQHPFIKDQVAEFDLPANENLDTVVLADSRGSLYATCGVLPRRTIVLPREFIDPSLKKLEPTFSIGPVLGYELQETLIPLVPAPRIEGMEAEFVHEDNGAFPELPMAPQIPVAELPAKRVKLTEGWVRMFTPKPPNP